MKKIDISTKKHPNTFTLVDDEDYKRINKYKWWGIEDNGRIYAIRKLSCDGYRIAVHMSREILRYVGGKDVDHKNHNTLDNQKTNLRLSTRSENCMNQRIAKNNKSGYKGVSRSNSGKKWVAKIRKDYKLIHLGYYINKIDAAKAYNEAALKLFGTFAYINEV